ncbi:MAG: hypothetical protein KAV83_03560 [Desulfobacterales bacterium]|nr:hypothetical protein [Desulfobacterales bacterium]
MKTCLCVSACRQVRYFTESVYLRKTGAKECPGPISISDTTFACQDRIEITGRPIDRRNLLMINGSPLGNHQPVTGGPVALGCNPEAGWPGLGA